MFVFEISQVSVHKKEAQRFIIYPRCCALAEWIGNNAVQSYTKSDTVQNKTVFFCSFDEKMAEYLWTWNKMLTFAEVKKTNMEKEKVTALERFKTAMRHKQEVKQQIIEEFASKGRKVDVVFL